MSASERRIAVLEQELDEANGQLSALRHLLSQQMRTGEELEVEGIVNLDGEGLLNVRWDELAAQFPTEQGRQIAFDILRCCEWADTDAKLYRFMRDAEFDDGAISGFMAMLREGRGGKRESAG